MSSYYHRFDGFIGTPKDGQTLREFIEWDCWARATQIQKKIEKGKSVCLDEIFEDVKSMAVNREQRRKTPRAENEHANRNMWSTS